MHASTSVPMSKVQQMDEVDKISSLFILEQLQDNDSRFTADVGLTPFKSGRNKYSSETRHVQSQVRERIQYFEDLLTVRILVLTSEPELGLFIQLHDSDGNLTEGHGYLHQDYVWRRNRAQYSLALQKEETRPTRKHVFKLEFEANPTFCQEHAFVELFPNTPKSVWFKLNGIESFLNEDSCIMSCSNVPFGVFEKCNEMFCELSSLIQECLKKDYDKG